MRGCIGGGEEEEKVDGSGGLSGKGRVCQGGREWNWSRLLTTCILYTTVLRCLWPREQESDARVTTGHREFT